MIDSKRIEEAAYVYSRDEKIFGPHRVCETITQLSFEAGARFAIAELGPELVAARNCVEYLRAEVDAMSDYAGVENEKHFSPERAFYLEGSRVIEKYDAVVASAKIRGEGAEGNE